MGDDTTADRRNRERRAPIARDIVWVLERDGARWHCELFDLGDFGTEAQIRRNDELVTRVRFANKALALEWCDRKK